MIRGTDPRNVFAKMTELTKSIFMSLNLVLAEKLSETDGGASTLSGNSLRKRAEITVVFIEK